MGWIRPDDALEGVVPAGAETDATGLVRRKHRFVVRADHDASIELAHDLKDLIDKHLVSGNLIADENRDKKHPMVVLSDLLAFLALGTGDEERGIYFEVAPTLTVRGAERDVVDFLQSTLGSPTDRSQDGVVDFKHEVVDGGEAEETHEEPFGKTGDDDDQV